MNIEIKEVTDDPLSIIVGAGHPWVEEREIEIYRLVESTMFISNQATTLTSYLHHLTGKTISEEKQIIMGNLESVSDHLIFCTEPIEHNFECSDTWIQGLESQVHPEADKLLSTSVIKLNLFFQCRPPYVI